MSGAKPPGSAQKKRKAVGAAAATVANKKKLEAGIGSLLARLEATNASFLQTAAAVSMQTQLAKVKVGAAGGAVDGKGAAAQLGRPATHAAAGLLPPPTPDANHHPIPAGGGASRGGQAQQHQPLVALSACGPR